MLRLRLADQYARAFFDLTAVPCGVETYEGNGERWRIFVSCFPTLEPETGGGTNGNFTSADLLNGDTLDELIDAHPLLGTDADFKLVFRSCRGAEFPLQWKIAAPGDLKLLKRILRGALSVSGKYFHARNDDGANLISRDFNDTTLANFVDLKHVYDRYCKPGLSPSLRSVLALNEGLPALSWESVRKVFEKELDDAWKGQNFDHPQIVRYQRMIKELAARQDYPDEELEAKYSQNAPPSPDDIIFALMQRCELAKQVGLVVEIEATFPGRIDRTALLEGALTLELGPASAPAARVPKVSTALSRIYVSADTYLVQPTSRLAGRELTLLTWLKSSDGDTQDSLIDYSFQSFSMDHSVIRNVLMPDETKGQFINPGKYPSTFSPRGFTPPAGRGVTVIGPGRDVVAQAMANPSGCTFDPAVVGDIVYFEDIWDGYRLDARRLSSNQPDAHFRSVHIHSVTFAYRDANGGASLLRAAETEDFIHRDQRTGIEKEEQATTPPDAPIVHPALFTWGGGLTFKQAPLAHQVSAQPNGQIKTDYVRDERNHPKRVAPTLLYGTDNEFRMRNVFTAGIGLSLSDGNKLVESLAASDTRRGWLDRVVARHRHTRNRPYSPGTFVITDTSTEQHFGAVDKRLSIGMGRQTLRVWLYPQPLDRGELEFHDLLRQAWTRKREPACVEGKLIEFLQSRSRVGSKVDYFADPDVTGVSVTAWVLGNPWLELAGNQISDHIIGEVGTRIRVTEVKPFLIDGVTHRMNFGEEDPFEFRPVLLRFKTGRTGQPAVRRCSRFGVEILEFAVPPGELIRLEVVPILRKEMIRNLTVAHESLAGSTVMAVNDSTNTSAIEELLARFPGFTTPLHLEVVHSTTSFPVPIIERALPRSGDNLQQSDVQVYRAPGETAVTLACALKVDPRLVGTANLRATWSVFEDDATRPVPSITRTPTAVTEERSVYFGPAERLEQEIAGSLSGFTLGGLRVSELYCCERSVLFGAEKQAINGASSKRDEGAKIEIGDLRHYRIEVNGVARGRHGTVDGKYARRTAESAPVTVMVPSSMLPPTPLVAHVMPLNATMTEKTAGGYVIKSGRQLHRIYLRRPWHVTGEGELLGFVFDKNWRERNQRAEHEVASPSTAWGEDPLYRTYESETMDNIDPGDLLSLLQGYLSRAAFDDDYPALIQTELSSDAFNAPAADPSGINSVQDLRGAHLVCVRPSFDAEERLWYVDLDAGDRNRWFRFQVCRYQHHALPGFHVSHNRAYVNFYSTRSIAVTVTRHVNTIEIMLDALPYSGVRLGDSTPDLAGRFELVFLNAVGDSVYERIAGVNVADPIHKADRGSVRYVWKLKADERRRVAIRDRFRERFEVQIKLEEFQ